MRLNKLFALSLVILLSIFFWSCDVIDPAEDENLTDYSCEGCHSSGAILANVINQLDLEPHEEAAEAPG
jgi:hypothetical protein